MGSWMTGLWTPDGPVPAKFLVPAEARYIDEFYSRANDEFTATNGPDKPLISSPKTWCALFCGGRADFSLSRGCNDAHFITHLAVCVKPGLKLSHALLYFRILGAVNRSMGGYPEGSFERALRVRNELEMDDCSIPQPIGLPVMKAVGTTADAAQQSAKSPASLFTLHRNLRRNIPKLVLLGYDRSMIVKDRPYPSCTGLIPSNRTCWRSSGPWAQTFTYSTSVAATRHGYRIEDIQLVCKEIKKELDQILVRDGYDFSRCIDFECSPESAMAFFHDRSKSLDGASRIILHYRFRGDPDTAPDQWRTPPSNPVSHIGSWRALLNIFVHRFHNLQFVELSIGESFWDAINLTSETDARTIFDTRNLFYPDAYYKYFDPSEDADEERGSTKHHNIFQRLARVSGIVLNLSIRRDSRHCPTLMDKFEGELIDLIVGYSRDRPLICERRACSCTMLEREEGNLNTFRKTCKFFQEVEKDHFGFY